MSERFTFIFARILSLFWAVISGRAYKLCVDYSDHNDYNSQMEWTLTDAKTHFSQVFDMALKGSEQIITRRAPGGGRERVILKAVKAENLPTQTIWDEIARLRKTMPLRATMNELTDWKNKGRR